MQDQTQQVTDPVCGMSIDRASAVASTEYDGRSYHFCSQQCAQTFAADPQAHTTAAGAAG